MFIKTYTKIYVKASTWPISSANEGTTKLKNLRKKEHLKMNILNFSYHKCQFSNRPNLSILYEANQCNQDIDHEFMAIKWSLWI